MNRVIHSAVVLSIFFACAGPSNSSVGSPSSLNGEAMGAGFHLLWIDNTSDETEFVIEQKVAGTDFQELTRVPFNTTQYMVETGQAGVEHRFRVSANRPSGWSAPSNESVWTPSAASTHPSSDKEERSEPKQPEPPRTEAPDAGVVTAPTWTKVAVVAHGTLSLSWQNPTPICETIDIHKKAGTAASFTLFKSVVGSMLSTQDSVGHSPGIFCYQLVCRLGARVSMPSNERCATQ